MSFGKFFRADFPHEAHAELLRRGVPEGGRPFDLPRYRVVFPDLWSAFLRRHYRDVGEVAVTFDVTERQARNWWEGANRPSGDKVALAAMLHPQAFHDHFGRAA